MLKEHRTGISEWPHIALEDQELIVCFGRLYNRVNNVPHYQRLFQEGQKNGVRQWNQVGWP